MTFDPRFLTTWGNRVPKRLGGDRGQRLPPSSRVNTKANMPNRSVMRLHSSRFHGARCGPVAAILMVLCLVFGAAAQTVQIDAAPSHVVNTFRPLRGLVTTGDRI